jgi:hypothetical protein
MIGQFSLPMNTVVPIITPPPVITPWVRSADWLALPVVNTGDQKIVILNAVFDHESNFCAITCVASLGYTVDWGDGTAPVNYDSGLQANKVYNYNTPALVGSESTRGYRQSIIVITPQLGGDLLTFNSTIRHPTVSLNTIDYTTSFLDMKCAGTNITQVQLGTATEITSRLLEQFEFVGTNSITNGYFMFANCSLLQSIPTLNIVITTGNSMFLACYKLQTTPLFDTSAMTDGTSMFQNCVALLTVPLYNLGAMTNGSNMFNGCVALAVVPLLNLSAVVVAGSMFQSCYAITSIPAFNFVTLGGGNSMFSGCVSLVSVDFTNLASMVTSNAMFTGCSSLTTIPSFNLPVLSDGSFMFNGCSSLTTIPLLNLSAMTNGSNMFNGCSSLTTIPLLNLSAMTNGSNMFSNCKSLKTIPLFPLTALVNGSGMFTNCYSIQAVPAFNLLAMTSGLNMFSSCISLKTVSIVTLWAMTNGTQMFNGCSSLSSLSLFSLASMTSGNNMFQDCIALQTIPTFSTTAMTNGTSMFQGCVSLQVVPAINLTSVTVGGSMFLNCNSLSKYSAINLKYSLSVIACRLSRGALQDIFSNSLLPNTPQTITITSNYGSDVVITKTLCGTTAGSNVITQTNTATLVIGMRVSGAGITGTGVDTGFFAVTLQDVGDTVTLTNHGLPDGKLVYLMSIVTTTGITARTPYYVVGATVNTFQLSLTSGGVVLPLTTNGTGTIFYASYITAINTNVDFTLDVTARTTGSVTLSNRLLDTSLAVGKGWAVIG